MNREAVAIDVTLPPQVKVVRCRQCAREQHHACEGHPLAGNCRCRQCWRRTAMNAYAEARRAARQAEALMWGDCLAACHFQTELRARAARNRVLTAPCEECGRPVQVRRRDSRGTFCRDRSSCRVKNRLRRKAQAEAELHGQGAGRHLQAPEPPERPQADDRRPVRAITPEPASTGPRAVSGPLSGAAAIAAQNRALGIG